MFTLLYVLDIVVYALHAHNPMHMSTFKSILYDLKHIMPANTRTHTRIILSLPHNAMHESIIWLSAMHFLDVDKLQFIRTSFNTLFQLFCGMAMFDGTMCSRRKALFSILFYGLSFSFFAPSLASLFPRRSTCFFHTVFFDSPVDSSISSTLFFRRAVCRC